MNRKYLAKSVGQVRRIRPLIVQTLLEDGVPPQLRRKRYQDDDWFVTSFRDDQLEMHNQRAGYVMRIGADNVREFLTGIGNCPDYLILKSQVFIEGVNLWSEPLARPFGTGLYAQSAPRRRLRARRVQR